MHIDLVNRLCHFVFPTITWLRGKDNLILVCLEKHCATGGQIILYNMLASCCFLSSLLYFYRFGSLPIYLPLALAPFLPRGRSFLSILTYRTYLPKEKYRTHPTNIAKREKTSKSVRLSCFLSRYVCVVGRNDHRVEQKTKQISLFNPSPR